MREKAAHRGGQRTGADRGTRPAFLGIDELVEDLRGVVTNAGARTVRTVTLDGTARLQVDQEAVAKAFAALVRRMACGATVTILGGVVPIKAGEEHEGKGCALLSVFVRGKRSAESRPSKDALAGLRELLKKQSGSFRLGRRRDEMRLSLYFPVLPGA